MLPIALPLSAQTGRNRQQQRQKCGQVGLRGRSAYKRRHERQPRRHFPGPGPGDRPGLWPQRGAAEHDHRPGAAGGSGRPWRLGFALEVAPERGPGAEPLRQACAQRSAKAAGGRAVSDAAVLTAHQDCVFALAAHAQYIAKVVFPARRLRSAPAPHEGIAGVAHIIAVASGKGRGGRNPPSRSIWRWDCRGWG